MTSSGRRHLRELASRNTPPMVMVPGIDGTALLFYRQQPLLANHFDVVAFPLPTLEPSTMTMGSLVADLAGVIAEVSDRGAVLLGESFGGALAMSTAIAHPQLVKGLVIVNSFPYLEQRAKLATAPRLLRMIPWGAMPLVRRYTTGHLHSAHTDPRDIAEFRRRAKSIDRDSYIRRLEILRDYDIRDRLSAIAAPVLFLAGDRDRLVSSPRWATYMAQRVPDATVTVLEGYGHVCLIDHDLDLTHFVLPWWTSVNETSNEADGTTPAVSDVTSVDRELDPPGGGGTRST